MAAYIGSAAAPHNVGAAHAIAAIFGRPQAGDFDPHTVTSLGTPEGELNLAKYASLRPTCW